MTQLICDVFLYVNVSQGVGSVTVIGPIGLKSSIDLMLPFTNRKYPALDIVEIENSAPEASKLVQVNQMTVNAFPVYASEVQLSPTVVSFQVNLTDTIYSLLAGKQ